MSSKKSLLGSVVRDTITGFTGTAIARHEYMTGCDRYSVQPNVTADSKLPDPVTFDGPMLVVVSESPGKEVKSDKTKGGPEQYMPGARPE